MVVMVGGTGTLDEATEILELKKHGRTTKPVVLLNTAGFYDGLRQQFQRMEDEGFLPVPLGELVFFAEEPAGALAYLEESVPAPWAAARSLRACRTRIFDCPCGLSSQSAMNRASSPYRAASAVRVSVR